ncbi:hypothetical protein [Bacillus thuringiensis]|uniref:hypothetical protein n=1 Tax=Bacillus thuringiensis TaxID=1428 RepID=UPI000B43A0FC|nr:hypothetical protein [Bacillus thuringiensis]
MASLEGLRTYITEFSPLSVLIFYESNILGVDPRALTASTLPLYKAGPSLFNSYKVDLPLYNNKILEIFSKIAN